MTPLRPILAPRRRGNVIIRRVRRTHGGTSGPARGRLASTASRVQQRTESVMIRPDRIGPSVERRYAAVTSELANAPYRDPSRTIAERASDLLGRMTLDEKLAQIAGVWPAGGVRNVPGTHLRHILYGARWQHGRTHMALRTFSSDEAREIGNRLGVDWSKVDFEQFRMGLGVELEHGRIDPDTDVTHDDPLVTGKIALAHLREIPDYYTRLDRMEKEAEGKA